MKRFTKTLFIVLVAVAFVATGCKKESEYKTVTLGAKIAPSNSKVYIENYTPKWQTNDQVSVNGNTITVDNNSINGNTAMLPNVPQSDDGYYAIYPAEYATAFSNGQFTVTLPAIQEYTEVAGNQVVKAPMGAKTDGGSLTFHNLCSLLKVTVNAGETLKISGIKVTAGTTNLSGSTSINLSGDATYVLPALGTGSKSVTLRFGNSGKTLSAGEHVFYIYLPAFNSQDVSVEVYNIDANNVLGVKKQTFGGISVSANTINTVSTGSLTASSFTTTGALNGLFSVSRDKKVYFSKGNLQYQASTNTWQFAENQYDYVGNNNGNISSSYSGWIDLFGWGTSGYNHGANSYQPYATSLNDVDYYAYGALSKNLYDDDGTADWGYNAISNGGNTANSGWRTLTSDEWNYLLTQRTTTYEYATVDHKFGLVILPDNWMSDYWDFSTNNEIGPDEWTESLEAHGAVFLPAAGYRRGWDVGNVGTGGGYWSSSAGDASPVWAMTFYAGNVNPQASVGRKFGFSVRLVQDY